MQDLGTLGGQHSTAYALNGEDVIVGAADTTDEEWHAFRYVAGRMEDIQPAQAAVSQASGINEAGRIVGTAQNGNLGDYAWVLDGPRRILLSSLTGRPEAWIVIEGLANQHSLSINNRNQIVASGYAREKTVALLFSPRQVPAMPLEALFSGRMRFGF